MKGRHPGPVGFAAVVAALLIVVAAAVAVRALTGGSPAESDANVTLPKAPGGSVATGSPSAAPTKEHQPKRGKLLIHGTGDVSLDPSYIPAFRTQGYGWAWSGLSGLFQRDDLTVINLECPATDVVDPESKQFVFRCDPASLPVARRFGVEVANQANNHTYDQGPDGLLDSLQRIRRAGIAPVGAGTDQSRALRAATFDLRGWRVAVVGIDEVLDPTYMVAGPDRPGTRGSASAHRSAPTGSAGHRRSGSHSGHPRRGALASDRPDPVALGGVPGQHRQADAEPGTARDGVSPAIGAAAPSCPGRQGG